jgi:hypothetical protein
MDAPAHGAAGDTSTTSPRTASTTHGPAGTCPSAPPAEGVVICGWPRAIDWSEFRELDSRPADVDEDAEIHSEGGGDNNMTVGRSGGQFRVASMLVNMTVESDSWVVRSRKSDHLLNHEQGHFDITGLLWRDMANDILRIRARTTRDLQREISRVMERYRPVFERMTDRYDTETNHSLNRDAQQRWDERIRNAIDRGTRFAEAR